MLHPPAHQLQSVFPIFPCYLLLEFENGDHITIQWPNGLDFDPGMLYVESKPFVIQKIMS
jgi:hypothetical protein